MKLMRIMKSQIRALCSSQQISFMLIKKVSYQRLHLNLFKKKKTHHGLVSKQFCFFFFSFYPLGKVKQAQAQSTFKTGFNGGCINNNKAKPQQWEQCSLLEASGVAGYCSYPKSPECLTICKCHSKDSTISIVILRP